MKFIAYPFFCLSVRGSHSRILKHFPAQPIKLVLFSFIPMELSEYGVCVVTLGEQRDVVDA